MTFFVWMITNQNCLQLSANQKWLFFFSGPIQSELHVPQKYKPIKILINDHFDIQVIISLPIGPQYMKITKRAYIPTYMDNISHLDGVCLIKR